MYDYHNNVLSTRRDNARKINEQHYHFGDEITTFCDEYN